MAIKIQICNVETLERLIGGDSEMEMEIRQSIVENFTKKHLKALVNTRLIQNVEKDIKNEVDKAFIGNPYSSRSITISDRYKEAIKDAVFEEVQKAIRNEVRIYMSEVLKEEDIKSIVESMCLNKVKEVAKKEIIDELNSVFKK